MKFVIYEGDHETFICTKKSEVKFRKAWFDDCDIRYEGDYRRSVIRDNGLRISQTITVS